MPEIIEPKGKYDWKKTALKSLYVGVSALIGAGVFALTNVNPAIGAITIGTLAQGLQNWWKHKGKDLLLN